MDEQKRKKPDSPPADARHRMEIRENMRKGYQAMSEINAEWAETGMAADYALDAYEAELSESDSI